MQGQRSKRLSPAFVVAMIALFVALGGTAGAVATQAVPLAKRALTADNAKKLGGQTSAQVVSRATRAATAAAQAPGPASTAAGLVVIKTGSWSVAPGLGGNFTVRCDSGQKAISGGWSDPGDWSSSYQSLPTGDGAGWTTNIWADDRAPSIQTGATYAICLK
jgi:hypothetical protein